MEWGSWCRVKAMQHHWWSFMDSFLRSKGKASSYGTPLGLTEFKRKATELFPNLRQIEGSCWQKTFCDSCFKKYETVFIKFWRKVFKILYFVTLISRAPLSPPFLWKTRGCNQCFRWNMKCLTMFGLTASVGQLIWIIVLLYSFQFCMGYGRTESVHKAHCRTKRELGLYCIKYTQTLIPSLHLKREQLHCVLVCLVVHLMNRKHHQ